MIPTPHEPGGEGEGEGGEEGAGEEGEGEEGEGGGRGRKQQTVN